MEVLDKLLEKTKVASKELGITSEETRNKALEGIWQNLVKRKDEIISANKVDITNAILKNISNVMIKRLEIDENKIISIANDIKNIINLKSPVGEIMETYKHQNGIVINKVRVPFGVICAIYESRPNVSIDIACLSIKTANACVLRGGSEAINTNKKIVEIIKDSIKEIINPDCVTLITDTDRALVDKLINAKEYIDLVVPRGGKSLINFITANSKVPFIETGAGTCHIYVDNESDCKIALDVITNAKVSKPSVCNAVECVLVNKDISNQFLKNLKEEMDKYDVTIYGCKETSKVIDVLKIDNDDTYYKEYNDFVMNVKVVNDVYEAVNHINKYGTRHSDCIITTNNEKGEYFLNNIDSACVYLNSSTRFSDGGEFGFGAELGISTQKLHARGPMGLKEMTTYKYKIYGEGQVR